MNKCSKCGTEFEGNFCPECGAQYLRERTCPSCGEVSPDGAKFCRNCGFSFENVASASFQVPAAPKRSNGATYRLFSNLPPLIFLVYSLLIFGFLGASVFGGIYEGIRSGYQIIDTTSYLRNYFIAIVALNVGGILIAMGYVVAHFRQNEASEDYCTVMASILLLCQIIVSSIIIGRVRNDTSDSLLTPGACPILLLVFSLLAFVTIIVIYFTAGHFYSETETRYMVSPNGYAMFEKEVIKVAPFAFESCGELIKANVPEGITEIGDNAFSRCQNLNWVSLPASLSRIGDYAFYSCGDLHDVVYAGTSSDWDAVDKGFGWCLATHGLVVHCVDKKITP